ncbi:MAG: hypothetical protein HKN17_00725 [Rhodothermales bacterium]|nr:hypothetical protein [Rhodothermales bacterium]
MPDFPRDPLESLYRAAQLVSASSAEADRLVRRVLESEAASPNADAAELMAAELAAGPASRDTDPVVRAVVKRDIIRRIPDALASLDPALRIRLTASVWTAAGAESGDAHAPTPSDRSVFDAFVRLVRAQLPWRRTSLGDDEYEALVRSALLAFMEEHTEPVPPAMSAATTSRSDRPAEEESVEEATARFLRRSRRFAAGLLLVVLAALLGTWLSTSNFQPEDRPAPRLFDAVLEHVDDPADFVLQTGDAGQAERYVRDRYGWSIVAPRIEGAALAGVESVEPVPEYELPVLRYEQDDAAPDVRVFVIPYSVIQQMRGEVVVDRSVLNQVADAGSFDIVNMERVLRVAWRHLDDVYVALVSSAPPGFESRISMP